MSSQPWSSRLKPSVLAGMCFIKGLFTGESGAHPHGHYTPTPHALHTLHSFYTFHGFGWLLYMYMYTFRHRKRVSSLAAVENFRKKCIFKGDNQIDMTRILPFFKTKKILWFLLKIKLKKLTGCLRLEVIGFFDKCTTIYLFVII